MKRAVLAVSLMAVLTPFATSAEEASHSNWRLEGSNTLRFEHYSTSGDESASPYGELGTFRTNELDFSLMGNTAPGVSWRFDFGGVYTDSPYRSPYSGFTPEVMRILHENTTAKLPYRIGVGDVSASTSPLTFSRSFKGLNLSLMPSSSVDGRRYHVDLLLGRNYRDWRSTAEDVAQYRGLSMGVADSRLGELDLNVIETRDRYGNVQYVSSVEGRKSWSAFGQALSFSGEWAKLESDTAESGEDIGFYGELRGQHQTRPLDYRLRYDRYGADFRPMGASVASDSEAIAAEAGWTFDSNIRLGGKAQRMESYKSTDNPTRTHSVSMNLSGPLMPSEPDKLVGRLDVVVQDRENETGSIDQKSTNASLGLDLRQNERNQSRLNLRFSEVDDRRYTGTEQISRQLSVSHRARVKIKGVEVSVAPGVSYSESDSYGNSATLGPSLSLEAAHERHRLNLSLGSSAYETDDPAEAVDTDRASLGYQFKRNEHTFGLDVESSLRDPAEGESTEAWSASMYWRYDFSKDLG